jgi:hypothetical protein
MNSRGSTVMLKRRASNKNKKCLYRIIQIYSNWPKVHGQFHVLPERKKIVKIIVKILEFLTFLQEWPLNKKRVICSVFKSFSKCNLLFWSFSYTLVSISVCREEYEPPFVSLSLPSFFRRQYLSKIYITNHMRELKFPTKKQNSTNKENGLTGPWPCALSKRAA